MRKVYVCNYNIISSLGLTIDENYNNVINSVSGISVYKHRDQNVSLSKIDWKRIDEYFHPNDGGLSNLEKIFIKSIQSATEDCPLDVVGKKTLFVISTIKGNINRIDNNNIYDIDHDRIKITGLSSFIAGYFNNPNPPVTVCNACISGVSAILIGTQLIQDGVYDNVIVSGGDIVSDFIVSGFNSFKAISPQACIPFDRNRKGLSLGEAAGTVVLSSNPELSKDMQRIIVAGGAVSNDANHISGPSRDGYGLSLAIENAVRESGIDKADIDSVSAHGTATEYNDEMESLAFVKAGINAAPAFSLKGYFGHTLGAAGIIESIISVHSMRKNMIIGSKGFDAIGVSGDIIINKNTVSAKNDLCVKTASGFGGCNAGVVFKKDE